MKSKIFFLYYNILKNYFNLSRGVLPENLRRGPYAVVDELVLDLNNTIVKSHEFAYFFGP